MIVLALHASRYASLSLEEQPTAHPRRALFTLMLPAGQEAPLAPPAPRAAKERCRR